MDTVQTYTISGYRIIVTERLYSIISLDYLTPLEGFINQMNAELNGFCVSVKDRKIVDLDFDSLVLHTFSVFYTMLVERTSKDRTQYAIELFTNFLTLNYVMLTPLDDSGNRANVLQLVLDKTPDGHTSLTGEKFLQWRSLHERTLNILH